MTSPGPIPSLYPGLRRALAAASGLLLLAGPVVASSVGNSEATAAAAPPLTTTTTSPPTAPTTVPTTAPRPSPSPTVARPRRVAPAPAPASPSTTPISLARPAAAAPDPVDPPRPGTYRYHYQIDGRSQQGTLVVAPDHAETEAVSGRSQTTGIGWSSTARTVTRSIDATGSPCNWAPPILSIRLPLKLGDTWQTDGACGGVHVHEEAGVTSRTRVTVDGVTMDGWVIQRQTRVVTKSPSGTRTVEQRSSELFAPTLGLVVYRTAKASTTTDGGDPITSSVITELESGRPS